MWLAGARTAIRELSRRVPGGYREGVIPGIAVFVAFYAASWLLYDVISVPESSRLALGSYAVLFPTQLVLRGNSAATLFILGINGGFVAVRRSHSRDGEMRRRLRAAVGTTAAFLAVSAIGTVFLAVGLAILATDGSAGFGAGTVASGVLFAVFAALSFLEYSVIVTLVLVPATLVGVAIDHLLETVEGASPT